MSKQNGCRVVGLAEIAQMGEMSYSNARRLRVEGVLPEPDQVLRMGPVWNEATIKAFLKQDRPPGRSRRESDSGKS